MSDQMPPLGPPYGPEGPPPPPRFPEHPPTEWGPRLAEPVPLPPLPPNGANNRRGLAIFAGVAAAVLLVVSAVAVFARDDSAPTASRPRRTTTIPDLGTDSTDSSGSDSTDSTDSTDSSGTPQDLDQVVADIKRFVEAKRGLKFKSDVPVQLLPGQAFDNEMLKGFDKERAETLEMEQVLKGLGLVPSDSDVVADMRELLSVGVLGFYDQETKRLVVRGTDTTPLVRQILAHELTHALDDQWFNLDRPQLDTADDETGFGFSALVEGSARTIEDAYHDTVLTTAEQHQADAEEQAITANAPQVFSLPVVLLALLSAPYETGRELVGHLDRVSATRLNDAFAQPPTTSEQVIEPDKFLAGEPARSVTAPTPPNDATAANRGALGVLMLQELLDGGLTLDVTDLDPALKGWGGDAYVTWVDGSRTCIQDVVVGDDDASTGTLLQRFQDWAGSAGVNATVAPVSSDAGSSFSITSCSG